MKNTNSQKFRILWKGQITGPFLRDEVEAKLKSNDVGIWAEISEGEGGWQPISEWRDRPKPKAKPTAVPTPAVAVPAQPVPPSNHPVDPVVEAAPPRLVLDKHLHSKAVSNELPPLPSFGSAPTNGSGFAGNAAFNDSQYEEPSKLPADGGFFYWAFMPFRKFGVFSGRARRKEYWLFTLFNLIIGFSLGFIAVGLDLDPEIADGLVGLYCLIVIIPSWAAGVRRLHDTNRSGWWLLISMIPFIGSLVLLLFSVQDGTDGENEYGVDPKLYS